MRRWVFLIALGALGALLLRTFFAEGIVIATGSMEPTLPVGTHAFVNKAVYWFRAPRRGEIVVFPSPVDGKKGMVKRVIAVAGDEVAIRDKKVVLNGREIEEPYVQYTRAGEILKGDNMEPRHVPPDQVFVLGDNRDQSGDSRDWIDPATGKHIYFVPLDRINGKLMGVEG